jgi:hypothetical protein
MIYDLTTPPPPASYKRAHERRINPVHCRMADTILARREWLRNGYLATHLAKLFVLLYVFLASARKSLSMK